MNHTPESASSNVTSDLTQLRADFSRLSDSVAGLVKTQSQTAADSLRGTVAAAGDKIAETAADLSNSAMQLSSGAEDKLRAASQDIEAAIERNPLTAVIIAAGIGLVIGLAAARS